MSSEQNSEVATLGGGCFWCLEAVFDDLRGVESVESGYAGGHAADPSYEEVCAGTTGHAEVVRVTFDPRAVSFKEILEVFFTIHDPTTLNRQGADVGTQYRSAIFFHTPEQQEIVARTIADSTRPRFVGRTHRHRSRALRTLLRGRDITRITPPEPEPGLLPHDSAPKVSKFRRHFLEKLRSKSRESSIVNRDKKESVLSCHD